MTKTSLNLPPRGRRGRLLKGAPVAFVLGLLLAACQGNRPEGPMPGQSTEVLMRVADDAMAGGDLGTAAGLYRRAAEVSPQDPRPLAKLGAVLLQLHAYTEASSSYHAALKISPNPIEAECHRGLAVVLLALNQPESALVELDAAVAKAPEDARPYNALGVAHDLLGHHDLAQQDYRNGLRLTPDNASLRNNYALSLALSHDYGAAVAALSELADRSDAAPRHRLNLALIYGLAGDDKKAAAVARTTLDEAAVANNLAYYAMLRGMDDQARANAIMGGQVRGPAVADAAPPPVPAAEATAAPMTPVSAVPLAQDATPQPKPATAHRPKSAASPPEPAVAPTVPDPAEAAVAMAAPTPSAAPAPAAPTPAETPAEAAKAPADSPAPAAPAPAAAGSAGDAPAASAPVTLAKAEAEPEPAKVAPDATPEPAAEAAAAKQVAADPPVPAAPSAASSGQEAAVAPSPPPAAADPAAASPEAVAAPVAAKQVSGEIADFALQLGAFAVEPNARKLAEHLNQKGYEAVVTHRRGHDGRDWFVVRTGGYATAQEAAAAARHFREAEQLPAVVVHLAPPSQA